MIDFLVHLTCKRPVHVEKLRKRLGLTQKQLERLVREARRDGRHVEVVDGEYVATRIPQGPHKTVVIGKPKPGRHAVWQCTDTHFGSEHCDLEAMVECAHKAWDRGARAAICTGDILDGWKDKILVEQRAVGFDRQAAEAVETVKRMPPFEWATIDGNHDGYFSSSIGVVSGELLEARMRAAGVKWSFAGVCLGRATIHGAKFHLWHPHGGASKRNTLRIILNERIEALQEAADVVAMGHFHKFASVLAYPENVLGVSGGTFQRQGSEFARRMTAGWDIGGPLVSFDLDQRGRVQALAAEFVAAR